MTRKTFGLLLLLYGLYAGCFIFRSSFILDGERCFSLFDDGMISMRYARNLAHGQGLVWNPGGERVEGFTNGIWVLALAALHLLPVGLARTSLLAQGVGVLLLAGNLVFTWKLARRLAGGTSLADAAAVLMTAFYLPLNRWGLLGMEVSLLAFLVSWAAWLACRSLDAPRANPWLYIVLGSGTLVRLDMAVVFLSFLLCLLVVDVEKRRQHAIWGVLSLVVFLGADTAFRWLYYGDLLPNAFYLKLTGYPFLLRIARGLFVSLDVGFKMIGILVVALAALVTSRDRRRRMIAFVILAQVAYSIYVGGDAWEEAGGSNRYVSIVMPLVFILFGSGLNDLTAIWSSRRARGTQAGWVPVGALVVALLHANAVRGPEAWREWLLFSRPLHAGDNRNMVEMARYVRTITREKARVAVVWAGAAPYFMERPCIDLLGRNDRVIAREPMHRPPGGASPFAALTFFYPGHLKYDYAYSIGQLKPDVVTQLWLEPETASTYLEPYQRTILNGFTLYLRKDSPNILWDQVEKAGQTDCCPSHPLTRTSLTSG